MIKGYKKVKRKEKVLLMKDLKEVKSEIILNWNIKDSTTELINKFNSINDLLVCLNDLTGQIVWSNYEEDTKENRRFVRNKLIDIIFGEL